MIARVLVSAGWLVCLSSAFLFKQETWDGLSVTFGVNPFDPNVFADLPRMESAAVDKGWTKIADCDENSKFRGVRYVKNDDYAVVLLFDVNGNIAGIQCGVAKAGLPSYYPPANQRGNIFQDDGDHYTLTAYFVDPATICSSGRTSDQLMSEGTGNALYIQNGSDPVTESVRMPSVQSDVAGTSWVLGHCFPAMGVHYWYNVSTDMSCDDFQPVFLLYNEKKLTAFGWALGVDQSSPRFEHPAYSMVSAFMNPVPKCLANYARLSTMHIYLTAHPTRDLC
ncbi:uncharacterized protein LOC143294080 [Babylonia areolata]|uniref:uncharacterized protein LOC143294080 n=1 Tax=Babylonia areolata TaxID=304850 RepID=UPI003FD4D28B